MITQVPSTIIGEEEEVGVTLPYVGFVGMCDPNGCRFRTVLSVRSENGLGF